MKTSWSLAAKVAVFSAAMIGGACSSDDDADDANIRTVRGLTHCKVVEPGYDYLGAVMIYTGGFGPRVELAINLAIKEINAAGGVRGRKLGFIGCDTQNDPTIGSAAAQELVDTGVVRGVVAVLSDYELLTYYSKFVDAKIPIISTASWADEVRTLPDDDYFYRLTRLIPEGTTLGKLALREGYSRAFLSVFEYNPLPDVRDDFQAVFDDAEASTSVFPIPSTAGYDTAAYEQASAFDPDLYVALALEDSFSVILNRFSSEGLDLPMYYGSWQRSREFVEVANNNAYLEGAKALDLENGPRRSEFQQAFKTLYNDDPVIFGAAAYDGIMLLATAIQLAGDPEDGSQVRDKLRAANSGTVVGPGDWATIVSHTSEGEVKYEGASSVPEFDAAGDLVVTGAQEVGLTEIQSGKIVDVGCIMVDTAEPCP